MKNFDELLQTQEASLLGKIKKYKAIINEIKQHLNRNPGEWGRFQSDFNGEVNSVFRNIMLFEKERLSAKDDDSVYKLKRLFITRLQKEFLYGEYALRSLNKPYGYAGDFRIIDDIYQNNPKSRGFERLFDNYFLMSAISVAVRNRKEDFKRVIDEQIHQRAGRKIEILDLASGPCRDILEIVSGPTAPREDVTFDCFDSDARSIEYAKGLLGGTGNVCFFEQNAVRLALMKDVEQKIGKKYDLIFSTGLFDYLDYRISVRLVLNLRKLLKPDGVLAISDVRDKFSNPSIYYMEWVGDWNLLYRDDEEFCRIFTEAGFKKSSLDFGYEQQGIMQYIFAKNI